jgi:hypothetical protein
LAAEDVVHHGDAAVVAEGGEAATCRVLREMRARWLRRRGKRLIRAARPTITAKRSAGRRWLAEGSLARCTALCRCLSKRMNGQKSNVICKNQKSAK